MSKKQIILSGVGGQGLIAVGSIIAEAAIKGCGMYAAMTSSYGVETRGTFTKSDVILSDSEIYYPEVMEADIVLALAQVAYDKYVDSLPEGAVFIYDSTQITKTRASAARQAGYAFTDIALDMGNVLSTNMLALGAIVGLTEVLPVESVVETIKRMYVKNLKVRDSNLDAFNRGYQLI